MEQGHKRRACPGQADRDGQQSDLLVQLTCRACRDLDLGSRVITIQT